MSHPAARRADARSRLPRWSADEAWLGLATPVLLFLGFLVYGAMLPQAALGLTCLWAGLIGVCLARPRVVADLARLDGLALPGVLYATVILVALWSLTPYVPGGPHPVWAYLHIVPGAATMDKSATTLEILKLLGLGSVFVVGLAAGGRDSRARLAYGLILILGATFAAWSFFAFVTTRITGTVRLEASFLNANAAGTVFATLFVLAAGQVASRLRVAGPGRLTGVTLLSAAALLFLVCLFLTASRGAFVGALAGLAAFAVLEVFANGVRLSRAMFAVGGAAIVLLGLLVFAGDFLLNRLLGSGETIASRATIAEVHWNAFLTSPLMGLGLGTFDTVNRTLLSAANFEDLWSVRAAHNLYLGWLEQAGLMGTLPMFACVGVLVLTTARGALRRSRAVSLIAALLAVDVVFMVHGVTDFALEMFALAAFWAFVLGLQFSLSQGSSTR